MIEIIEDPSRFLEVRKLGEHTSVKRDQTSDQVLVFKDIVTDDAKTVRQNNPLLSQLTTCS